LRFSHERQASTTQRRVRHLELELLATRADVRGEPARDGEVMHAVVVIAAIQAEPLCGYFSLGAGRSIGIESMVGSTSFESWRLAPSCAHPTGTPAASQNRTLRPLLALIWSGSTRARGQPAERFLCISQGTPGSDRSLLQPPQFP
jgi:hypothetical protein